MTGRTARRIGALALLAAALACAWALLAPPQLGGSTRYAILDGTSMEPSLSAGDLALVRAGGDVGTGDVVLYEHPRLGAHVLHRIVRERDGTFILKGDNNDFLDDARPTADDVKGELWFAVPRAGSAISWARQPLHAALVVFVLAFVALGGVAAVSALRSPPGRGHVSSPGAVSGSPSRGAAQTALGIALGATVVFALLAIVSFSRPTTRLDEVSDAYAHVGAFSYSARVEPSDVYPDGVVDTGETAFLQLVPALDVGFRYRLDARDVAGVRGTTTLFAVLSDGMGWSRTLPLGDPAAFTGSTAEVAGTLDLEEVAGVVDEMKALTGSGTSTFGVTIAADVDVRGRVSGERVSPGFEPTLRLALDPVALRPESAGGEQASFTVRHAEALKVTAPAALAIGGLRLSVADARRLALLGVAVALLAAALAGLLAARTRDGGAPSEIAALLGDRLIALSRPPSADPDRVTELGDVASLVRIAERCDRIVLHWRVASGHAYQIDDGVNTFRYCIGAGIELPASPGGPNDEEDTLVLAPIRLPQRAAAG